MTLLLCPSCTEPLHEELSGLGFGLHPGCEPLPTSPEVVSIELVSAIRDEIVNQPRTQQQRIGPSEIGIPCDRRIGHKLAGTAPVNRLDDVGWKAYVGTAVHEQFGNIMARLEIANVAAGMGQRWHVEEKVAPGLVLNDEDIDGSCDLFDAWTGIVFDWKFTTRNKIREQYRPHGPGDQYRVQAHNYAAGWARRGFPVRYAAIFFWTRDGEFDDRHLWYEPFDQSLVDASHQRLARITTTVDAGQLITLPTASAYCNFCPYFKRGAVDLNNGCPGHNDENETYVSPLQALIA